MLQESAAQLGFEFIRDLSVELITLATGVTAITIAASERGMLSRISPRARTSIRVGWVLCLLSVGAGILQLMALTGALAPPVGAPPRIPDVPANARFFGLVQILAFALGMVSLVTFAWRGIGLAREASEVPAGVRVPALKLAPGTPATGTGKRRKARR
jgi:hypothetical protein